MKVNGTLVISHSHPPTFEGFLVALPDLPKARMVCRVMRKHAAVLVETGEYMVLNR